MFLSLSVFEYCSLALLLIVYWFFNSQRLRSFILLIPSIYIIYSFGLLYLVVVLMFLTFTYFIAKRLEVSENEGFNTKIYWTVFILYIFIFLIGEYINDQYLIFGLGFGLLTLQQISFVSDVYFEKLKDKVSILSFYLYFLYFPKFLVGPVEKTSNLYYNLNRKITWNWLRFDNGLVLILIGVFKKLVIADNILGLSNESLSRSISSNWLVNWANAFLNFVKIYSDFSGMIDIILGVSLLFGYDLLINFNKPFQAKGFRDYWNRWHISLSSWVLEYFYMPLTFQLRDITKKLTGGLIVILSFMIISVWHGYSISYFIFGILHAVFIILESYFKIIWISDKNRVYRYITRIIFFMLISVITLFFTELNFTIPISYAVNLFDLSTIFNQISLSDINYLLFSIILFVLLLMIENHYSKSIRILSIKSAILIFLILLLWPDNPQKFIYQF